MSTFLERWNYTAVHHYGFLGNRANYFESYQLLQLCFTQTFSSKFQRLVDLDKEIVDTTQRHTITFRFVFWHFLSSATAQIQLTISVYIFQDSTSTLSWRTYQKKKGIGKDTWEGRMGNGASALEKSRSSMGSKWRDEWLAVLRVLWRGQQSNYGTTKDRHRTGRGSEKEREMEEKKKKGVGVQWV